MFTHLQVYDPRERWLVGSVDLALGVLTAPARLLSRRPPPGPPERILLLRVERIGDLLMTRAAVAAVRALAPGAAIDLVVGSWNLSMARLLPGPDRIEALDMPWLARGSGAPGWPRLVRTAVGWRSRRYDLGINFEGDVRSHLLLALSGARRRVGFTMGGGGPLLTDPVAHDPRQHTAVNSLLLVERAFGRPPGSLTGSTRSTGPPHPPPAPRPVVPDHARRHAQALLDSARDRRNHPAGGLLIGVHAGGARPVKQWPADRFADVATRLARRYGAAIVLTGNEEDAAVNHRVRALLPADVAVIDLTGEGDLLTLAAVLEQAHLFLGVDSGPMHVAAAVGTPIVAVFGPSDPGRWGPLSPEARVVRADLPCSPCNRVRRPPERCVGHVADCLAVVGSDAVYAQAVALLDDPARPTDWPAGERLPDRRPDGASLQGHR